jgi:tRNA(Ile)-lysidine synthase
LLPLLEREYNPRIREALVRTARILQDEEEVWAVLLKQAKGQTGWVEENGRVLLSARSVIQMGPALARRLIRSAAARVVPDVQGLAWDHVEAVLALCREGSGARDLPDGPRVRVRDGWLRIETRGEAPIQGYSLPLLVPGETELSVRSGRIHAVMEPDPRTLDPSQYQGNRVLMDADAIQGPLRVRSVQPGDRYQPLGLTGTRKLADVFREAGLSVEARRLQPIIVDDEGILWPVTGRPAHRVRITASTRNTISLVFEPGPPRENGPDPKSNHAALNDG